MCGKPVIIRATGTSQRLTCLYKKEPEECCMLK
jgi:hypothetical protein